jgi:hypothetical protein
MPLDFLHRRVAQQSVLLNLVKQQLDPVKTKLRSNINAPMHVPKILIPKPPQRVRRQSNRIADPRPGNLRCIWCLGSPNVSRNQSLTSKPSRCSGGKKSSAIHVSSPDVGCVLTHRPNHWCVKTHPTSLEFEKHWQSPVYLFNWAWTLSLDKAGFVKTLAEPVAHF